MFGVMSSCRRVEFGCDEFGVLSSPRACHGATTASHSYQYMSKGSHQPESVGQLISICHQLARLDHHGDVRLGNEVRWAPGFLEVRDTATSP